MGVEEVKSIDVSADESGPPSTEDYQTGTVVENVDHLRRRLGNRQIQLIAIGGSIGTALFISIGNGLLKGGPGSLFLAFALYASLLGLVNNCMAEMACFMPISGSIIRMAGKWVDESFGFMAGWNFFLYEAILIPWEISALNLVLTFWSDDIPIAAVCAACIVLYGLLNVFAIKYYGEAEFWLVSGKVLLIAIVFAFTFVTMVGGNPQHDAYGFRHWRDPGAFAEFITTGSLGRFEGFLGSLWTAAFTIVGPEYLAIVAGEAKQPRIYLKAAFKTMYWRFGVFFIVGALCVGIIVPYNDPTLIAVLSGASQGAGTAAASPYVIAMQNISLYGLALEGQAPAFLKKCTKSGVPIYCYVVTMFFPLISFLQVSSGSAQVITWLANLITASQIINYIVMSTTYIFFYRALKTQGIDRSTLPYVVWFQPYSSYIGLGGIIVTVTCYGYTTFLPGRWDTGTFFSYYLMLLLAPFFYGGWKIYKRTKFVPASQADLVWDKPIIDAYGAGVMEEPTSFWREIWDMLKLKPLTRLIAKV